MAGENINTYQGTAAVAEGSDIGGGMPVSVQDFKQTNNTLDRLMYYQFVENQDRWARGNVEADNDAKLAGEMSKFDLSDWVIPEDTKAVMDAVGEYNKLFASDPTATKILTDLHTGKVLNADAYQKLQNARNKVNHLIGRANTRTAKYKAIQTQVDAIPYNSTMRPEAEGWLTKEAAKPIDNDLIAYPDWTVHDISKDVAPTLATTNAIVDADTIKQTKATYPDIVAGVNKVNLSMLGTDGHLVADAYDRILNQFKMQVSKITDNNPNANMKDEDIANAMSQDVAGQNYASLYNKYMQVAPLITTNIKENQAQLKNSGIPPTIDLRNLTRNDIIAMVQANSVEPSIETTLEPFTVAATREGNRLDYKAKMAETNKEIAATTGSAKIAIYSTIANAVTAEGEPSPGFTPEQRNMTGKSIDKILTPSQYKMIYNNAYEVPLTQPVLNVFRKGAQGQYETISTNDPTQPTVTKQKDMNIVGVWAVADKDRNIDNNQYMVVYQNPDPAKKSEITTQFYNNNDLWTASSHVNDNTGTGGRVLLDADKEANTYLLGKGVSGVPKASVISKAAAITPTVARPKQAQTGKDKGKPAPAPLAMPVKADGKPDTDKMISGQEYLFKGKIYTK